ncbi:hypothetical protein MMC07_006144 [Pseudocyphellaria aurata]|nr:hypothetical protein [Pseudocyphellaria aurata]
MDPVSAIGVAGSVVGIVSLGMELARILQGQIDQIATAKDRLSQFVFEVKATALALTNLQDVLLSTRNAEDRLFSDRGYDDIKMVVDRCTIVYRNIAVLISKAGAACLANVDDFVDKIKKPDAKPVLTLNFELSKANHLLWPLKYAKVEQCVADLERLKLHLILMLNVAALAKKKMAMVNDEVTTEHKNDEETLLVDQVYYTNEDVDRVELKYEENLLSTHPGKDKIYGGPDFVKGSNRLAANDLIDNWPHRSEKGGIPSPAEIRQLGVIITGFTLDRTWRGTIRWSPVPVSVLAMQRVAIQNFQKKKRSRSPWDDFTRLSYAHRQAIACLIGNWDNVLDAILGEDHSHYEHFNYPQPRLLSVETKWDRRTTFSKALNGLDFFRKPDPDVPGTHPQLRVVLGCAPTIHNDDDRYSTDWEYRGGRNVPPHARYAPTGEAGFDPEFVDYTGAPIDTYRNYRRNSEMKYPYLPERYPVSDYDEDYVIRDDRFPRTPYYGTPYYGNPYYGRRRPDPADRDDISTTENRKERKKSSRRRRDSFEEDEISTMEELKERRPRHGQETSRDRMNYSRKQREIKREIEREIERGEWRERPRQRHYDDSYRLIRPLDSRSSTRPMSSSRRKRGSSPGFPSSFPPPGDSIFGYKNENQFLYDDRRDLLPSRMSFPITTKNYAFAPRLPSYDQPSRRHDTYSSRRRDQSLQVPGITESFKNRREPRYSRLSYSNGGYGTSTFEDMNLSTQVPPSRESKIQVAEDLLRHWTIVFDMIAKKVRDRVLDQHTANHRKLNSTITPFPQRPDAASASANPQQVTTLNPAADPRSEIPQSVPRPDPTPAIVVRNRDQDQNHAARRGQESTPRRRSPRVVTIEDAPRHDESHPTVSSLSLTDEEASEDERR